MSCFETSDSHEHPRLKPLRVALLKQGLYEEAKTMAGDLAGSGWKIVESDDERLCLVCERAGGFLRGTARVTIRVDGPDGIPSATAHVRSETASGLWPRDRANVLEFLLPFHRRVC